jgi:hypothetical protein
MHSHWVRRLATKRTVPDTCLIIKFLTSQSTSNKAGPGRLLSLIVSARQRRRDEIAALARLAFACGPFSVTRSISRCIERVLVEVSSRHAEHRTCYRCNSQPEKRRQRRKNFRGAKWGAKVPNSFQLGREVENKVENNNCRIRVSHPELQKVIRP